MNLAVSLHFAENEMRGRYMPINKQYDLEEIKEALQKYFQKSKRKIFIEYILFQGLNDSLQDARKLSEYLKSIGHTYLLHVNLIFYNERRKKKPNDFKSFPQGMPPLDSKIAWSRIISTLPSEKALAPISKALVVSWQGSELLADNL